MASYQQSVIDLLFDEAIEAKPVFGARVAAAIVYKNKIISIGRNQKKTHPFQVKYCKHPEAVHLHAETQAIIKALKHLTVQQIGKTTMYIARARMSSNKGHFEYGNVLPCAGCVKALEAYKIKTIYYTNDEGMVECL